MYACVCVCRVSEYHMCMGTHKGQMMISGPLELDLYRLWATILMLGTGYRSSARVVSDLNHGTTSSAFHFLILVMELVHGTVFLGQEGMNRQCLQLGTKMRKKARGQSGTTARIPPEAWDFPPIFWPMFLEKSTVFVLSIFSRWSLVHTAPPSSAFSHMYCLSSQRHSKAHWAQQLHSSQLYCNTFWGADLNSISLLQPTTKASFCLPKLASHLIL